MFQFVVEIIKSFDLWFSKENYLFRNHQYKVVIRLLSTYFDKLLWYLCYNFRHVRGNRYIRKCVIGTNIAETSVTVPQVMNSDIVICNLVYLLDFHYFILFISYFLLLFRFTLFFIIIPLFILLFYFILHIASDSISFW